MAEKQLSVRINGIPVGLLEQTPVGKLAFNYLDNADQPLSIGMPPSQKSYDNNHCEAFFGGLLPESEQARKALGKRFGISPNNTFSLLKEIGLDCAGAVSFHLLDTPTQEHTGFELAGRFLSNNELSEYIQELPSSPLFVGVDDLRLSLAGVQDKAAVCLIDNQVAIPKDGCPTTHILKPAIRHFTGTVQNEFFCMRVAKRLGLNVANVEMRMANSIPYLLVERYDRVISENRIRRIHQEDFCQALGILTSRKYQNEGGPGFKQCFDLLRETSTPVVDRTKFAQMLIFNYLIGNNDAHAKNFSILHTPQKGMAMGGGFLMAVTYPEDNLEVAPLYDVVCTRVYEKLSKKMAMKIGSKYEIDDVMPHHWEQLCKDAGYSYPLLKQNLLEQASALLNAVKEEKALLEDSSFDMSIVNSIVQFLDKHCQKTLRRFE